MLKKWIEQNCFRNDGKIISKTGCENWWENRNKLNDLMEETNFLPSNSSFIERIYCILNNKKNKPKCKNCENSVKFYGTLKTGYNDYCSSSCSTKDLILIEQRLSAAKKTNLLKYGVDNPSKNKEIKELISKKLKGGAKTYKNGHPSFQKFTKEQKALLRTEDFNKLIEEQKTTPITVLSKKYGFSNSYLHKIFKEKEININILNISQSSIEKEILFFIRNSLRFREDIQENTKKIINPKEIDIFIPSKNLAIEINGIYWHSENKHPNKLNINLKQKLLEEKGIKVLNFFDTEWLEKAEICKSIISTNLGVFTNIINGRDCVIKEIDNSLYEIFCNENHIQGYCKAKIKIGLFFKNELVSVMSFSNNRYSKNEEYEMIRFCNKLNTKIHGGASKLFKYFVNNYKPNSICSFSDRRFFDGKLYEILGFKRDSLSKPNYFYFKNYKLHSRLKFQKHKLKDILEVFDPNISEYENMKNNNWNRIWDSGNIKYVYYK